MAGRAPRLQTCSRTSWLLRPRSATTHSGTPGRRASSGRRAAARAPGRARCGRRRLGRRPRRSRPPWSRSRRASGRAPRARLAPIASPSRAAPAAFRWVRIEVPSRKAVPSATPRPCAAPSRRCQTPRWPQRSKACAALHQGPSSAGMARQAAPLRCRQTIASIDRRRSRCSVLPQGRTAPINGAGRFHRAAVNARVPLPPAIPGRWVQSSRANGP